MIYLDSESCGLHGVMVLLQWAEDDGPIHMHSVWTEPISKTLQLIEKIANHPGGVCAYNIAFDWFHIQKIYNLFSLFPGHWYPDLHIDEIAAKEREAIWGDCVKPVTALDLMLHAVKGPYQSVMERKDIVIRRVPSILADKLVEQLNHRVQLRDIYFSRKKNKKQRWQVMDCKRDGRVLPNFRNVVLSFAASKGLKNVAIDALGCVDDDVLKFKDIELDRNLRPAEVGWGPFHDCAPTEAKGKGMKKRHPWPVVLHHHINHWTTHLKARQYAEKDVDYLRLLRAHFGNPQPGDDDSVLACSVASTRWRGYSVDTQRIKDQIAALQLQIDSAPRDPRVVLSRLESMMSRTEWLFFDKGTTKKTALEEVAKWTIDDQPHPAALFAIDVLKARTADKLRDTFQKILKAGRLHASFKVIGALSGRMSGADGLNPHGINKADSIRACFTFADPDEILSGGDFKSFEVSIAEATYKDPLLREQLLSGKKIHALFGEFVYKHMTYQEIVDSDGSDDDVYTKCKQAVFAMFYGAMAMKIAETLGISEEDAQKAIDGFFGKYIQAGIARAKILDRFCSMKQPQSGGAVYWKDPDDFVESGLGFRRYFTMENQITKILFELASNPPKEWNNLKVKIVRRNDGTEQYVGGATRSALYGAAFGMQALNMRAALNHEMQAFGAGITKQVQRKVWDLQPSGVHPWKVRPSNYHDEINVAHSPELAEEVERVVQEEVESFKPLVPLIGIDWKPDMADWSSKHSKSTDTSPDSTARLLAGAL